MRQETGSFYTEINQPLLLHTQSNRSDPPPLVIFDIEGGNTWLVIFDILLTIMVKIHNAARFYIHDAQGTLRLQNPTAFADDLLTYDPDQEGVQQQANVISFFCMMTGLEIAPTKMEARATNALDPQRNQTLNIWTLDGSRTQVPIICGQQDDDQALLRYLGVYVEHDISWRGQYETAGEDSKSHENTVYEQSIDKHKMVCNGNVWVLSPHVSSEVRPMGTPRV
jgi:hypothetical protein